MSGERFVYRLTMMRPEHRYRLIAPCELCRDKDTQVVGERPRTPVEQFVECWFKYKAVVHCVRTTLGMPFDVRRFYAEEGAAERCAKTRHHAAVLVGAENVSAKLRVSLSSNGSLYHDGAQTNGLKDVFVKGLREVFIQQPLSDYFDGVWIVLEKLDY